MNILIIEDNFSDAEYLKEIILYNQASLDVEGIDMVTTLSDAIKKLDSSSTSYDVLFLDLGLPDCDDRNKIFDGLRQVKERSPDSVIIVVTGNECESRYSLGLQSIKDGAQDFLIKGYIDENSVKKSITYSLERQLLLTNFRKKEAELKTINKKLKKANNTKSEFLAKMSHEIRTPLNLIIGMGDLLRETSLSNQQSIYVDKFERSGVHLLNLINDILDFSKIEAGKMELQKEEFDFLDLTEEIIDFTSVYCRSKKLRFLYEVDHFDKNKTYIADVGKIRQILLNLINNALKFTKKGHIALKFGLKRKVLKSACNEKEKSSLLHDFFCFSIADTGPGISSKKKKEIFKTFYQVDSTATRKERGTGLGLAIVKGFVDLMKGYLGIESEENKGSTFSVEIPILEQKPYLIKKDFQKIKNKDLKTKTALIASSSFSERKYLGHILSSHLIKAYNARSGKEAQVMLEKNKGKEFDILFIDLHMDPLGGFQLMEKIEHLKLDLKKIVFLVPCIHRRDDIDRIQEKKGACFLLKPCKRKNVENILNQINNIKDKTKVKISSPLKTQKKSLLKILIAEDDPDNTFLFQSYLNQMKDKIQFVKNGKEALMSATKNSYDLIFMDIQMPIMDGLTASHKIQAWHKKNKEKKPPKIFALSANAFNEYVEKIPKNLFSNYLTKPIQKEKLLQAIESVRIKVKVREEKEEKKIA